MNIRLLIMTVAVPTCLFADYPESAKPSVAQESLALLKENFSYAPATSHETDGNHETIGEVVKMERFVVADWLLQRELSKKIEGDSQKIKNEQFSFRKGGSFFKNDRYELGAWGDSPDLKLFSEDAKYTDKKPVALIGLLHIKF